MKKIAVVTTTRADWGLLNNVARNIADNSELQLQIIAANMHFDPSRGMTLTEIEDAGFAIDYKVLPCQNTDTSLGTIRSASMQMSQFGEAYDALGPDIVLLLGDRYETLAAAMAATLSGIPIAHISGGEITEGAFDDNIRHAITKLASLHFASTEDHRRRIIQMGEEPSTVFNVGALGVENMITAELLDVRQLTESLGFDLSADTLLVTFHPATNDLCSPAERFDALLKALEKVDNPVLFTYPNNDPRSEEIIAAIEDFHRSHPDRVHVVPSLGRLRYLSALKLIACVVGNSSSGIVEAPSAGIPTVDIGIRQRGRTAAPSVIHCGNSTEEINLAFRKALSPEFREIAALAQNPYYQPGTAARITEILAKSDPSKLLPKHFYDIRFGSQNITS